MEKDFESWFHQQHLLGYPFEIGGLSNPFARRNPYFVGDLTLRTVPPFCPVPQLKPLSTNVPYLSSNWCYGTPLPYKAFAPVLNSVPKEWPLTGPTTRIEPGHKRFLVFDQSGEKTTLLFSSGVKTDVQHGTHLTPIPPTGFNLNKEPPRDKEYHFKPITKDEYGGNKLEDSVKDEMREDTEELNALLYSDNDSYFLEDDEEMSTGHSPSTMIDNGVGDTDEETGEEVDSSFGPCKRQKLLNGTFNVASNICSTKKSNALSSLEDDAESSCGNGNNQVSVGSLSGGKRSRTEKIRKTLKVLQSSIPGVKGKNAIVVIDEAINYLKSLKVKAMALGLDTL